MLGPLILWLRKASFIRNGTISYARESLPHTLMITQPRRPSAWRLDDTCPRSFSTFTRDNREASLTGLADRTMHYLSGIRNESNRSCVGRSRDRDINPGEDQRFPQIGESVVWPRDRGKTKNGFHRYCPTIELQSIILEYNNAVNIRDAAGSPKSHLMKNTKEQTENNGDCFDWK